MSTRPEEVQGVLPEVLCRGVTQTAGLLGIAPRTVRQYIAEGKLRAVKIGRRLVVEDSALREFLEKARKRRAI